MPEEMSAERPSQIHSLTQEKREPDFLKYGWRGALTLTLGWLGVHAQKLPMAFAEPLPQPPAKGLELPSQDIDKQISAEDFAIQGPNGERGWFFTQTSGEPLKGFEVLDDKDAKFWEAFGRFGGVSALGYPISQEFELDGFRYQAFQNVWLQSRPEAGEAVIANLASLMSEKELDPWLEAQGIPKPFAGEDRAVDWEDAKRIRLGWLTDPDIRDAYLRNPNPREIPNWDPVVNRGLPESFPVSMGPFVAQRFQRGAIIKWVQEVPRGQPVGTIQFANLGTLSAVAGLIPQEVLVSDHTQFGSGGSGNGIINEKPIKPEEALSPSEVFLRDKTQVIDQVDGILESRASTTASSRFMYNPKFKDGVGDFIEPYLKKAGVDLLVLVTLGSEDELPEDAKAANNGGTDPLFVNSTYVGGILEHRVGNNVVVYFVPREGVNFNNPSMRERLNRFVSTDYLEAGASGGAKNTNILPRGQEFTNNEILLFNFR